MRFPILAATPLAPCRIQPWSGVSTVPRPRRIAEALRSTPQAALPLHCVYPHAGRDSRIPPSLRCCHSLMLVRRLTAQTAPASTLPPAVSRVARPHFPPLLPCCVSPFHSDNDNTATPAPFPLRYANSAKRFTQPTGRALHSCVISGHLPGLRSRSRTTCSLRDPGSLRSPPSGKIASGPRIRAESFVSLRTEPGFCGPHQSGSHLHGQNSSSLRSSQDCPFRPLYSYVATQPNREDPSGKRLLLRPFPLSQ